MKSDASSFTTGFTTNVECGNIPVGTTINSGDKVTDVVKSMLWEYRPPEPSTEYESRSLGTWSSTTDVNNFFNAHNVDNGFEGIKIGNYVTIQDGTYNTVWTVAGFNLERRATASDGTVYDNGYGMLMIPKTHILMKKKWYTSSDDKVSYINSTMHTSTLVTATNNMKNILGNHMINRNVLLGSEQNGTSPISGTTSAYQWTTSYLTLMSIGQMNGVFASNNNKYDDGEANYKLPLFDHEDFKTGYDFWTRCVHGFDNYGDFNVWYIPDNGIINSHLPVLEFGVRPLMLLR